MLVELRYRDAHGSPRAGAFELGAELDGGDDGLRTRRIHTRAGVECTQRYLPAGEHTAAAQARLETEIRATARLWQLYGGASYPAHLPRLIGFDLGSDEPYAIFEGHAGRPLTDVRGMLDADAAWSLWSGLVSALLHTTAAGIAHGDVGPANVWWDGTTARLVHFGNARIGAAPDASADVRGAAVILAQAVDGSPLPRRLRRVVKSAIRPPGTAPTVVALARRTGVPTALAARKPDAALDDGRRRFEAISAAKDGRPGSARPRARRNALVAVALTVVSAVLVVLVIGALS